ncbi:hypothetical protein E4U21_002319 [Claviceps maximensis]|nr:hypothetical protein E4U21_002319 [Claviceps maximensis]
MTPVHVQKTHSPASHPQPHHHDHNTSKQQTPPNNTPSPTKPASSPTTPPPSEFLMKSVLSPALVLSSGCIRRSQNRHHPRPRHQPHAATQGPQEHRRTCTPRPCARPTRRRGLLVRPLPLRIATRATPTPAMLAVLGPGGDDGHAGDVTSALHSCEPLAVCYHRCASTLAFKVVFWYAAQADSLAVPVEGTQESWEEQYKVRWVDARAAAGQMSMVADGEVIDKMLSDMRASGYDI